MARQAESYSYDAAGNRLTSLEVASREWCQEPLVFTLREWCQERLYSHWRTSWGDGSVAVVFRQENTMRARRMVPDTIPASANAFQYTGREFDSETGL